MPKIEHIALWVSDLEGMRRFYETYFGARPNQKYTNPQKRFQSYFLSFEDGSRLEIMQRPDIPLTQRETPTQEFMGYAHLAIAVGSEAEVDELTANLVSDGFAKLDGPRRTGDGYYESVILDPEGNRIEITV